MQKQLFWMVAASLLLTTATAQIPLNQRDQKRKAEFEAQIQNEENYKKTIEEADRAFREKRYVDARMSYQSAKAFNAEQEQWLTSKVNDLDILMAKNIAAMVDSIPMAIPVAPVSKVPMEEKPQATILPRNETPIRQNEPPRPVEAAKPSEPKPVPPPPPTAPIKKELPKVVREDFSKLAQGITEEEFNFPDHKVKRLVVKDGIDVIVYKRVTHRWGGDFCFRDEISISERQWLEEIEAYRKKFPAEK